MKKKENEQIAMTIDSPEKEVRRLIRKVKNMDDMHQIRILSDEVLRTLKTDPDRIYKALTPIAYARTKDEVIQALKSF